MGCSHTICRQCIKVEKETDISISADDDDITGDFDHTNLIAKPQEDTFGSIDTTEAEDPMMDIAVDDDEEECPIQPPCDPKTGLKPGYQCVKW